MMKMESKYKDLFNKIHLFKDIENSKFISINNFKNPNSINYRISIPLKSNVEGLLGDMTEYIPGIVYERINGCIFKSIIKYIEDNGEYLYLDCSSLVNGQFYDHKNICELLSFNISKLNSRNIITNGRILSDYIAYNFNYKQYPMRHDSLSNNIIYNVGKINNSDIYEYHIMKWSSNILLMFDEILIDFKIDDVKVDSDILKVSFNLFISSILNPKIMYLYTDDHMSGYPNFIQYKRNEKISDILNESR